MYRIDDKFIISYTLRVVIILCVAILIALLVGSCEFTIDRAFSKPEVRLEFIMQGSGDEEAR
tara:strand:+ start:530 stop:715 length:186 start_codon:yes stop_codon:yes gene_type:complete